MEFIKWNVKSINVPEDKENPLVFGMFKFNNVDKELYGNEHLINIINKYHSMSEFDKEEDCKIVFVEDTEAKLRQKAIKVFKEILDNVQV